MTKYLSEYRRFILECLKDDTYNFKQLLDYHKDKIKFFQHERFIHLIVTVLFAIATIITIVAIVLSEKITLIPLAVLLLVLLIPYIKHYFFLENTTQLLYKDYDEIYNKVYGISQKGKD